ncbi:hypothetical protein J0H58_21605 [bacterium]|nr:hypothetical protein [bacterium]
MAVFKDAEGREWRVAITAGDLRPVRESTGVHLGQLVGNGLKGLAELLGDPINLIDVVRLLVRRQHPAVTDEAFGRALGGDALEDMANAFVEAVADFSPRQFRRPLLALKTKAAEVETRAAALLMEKVAEIDPGRLLTPNASAGSSPGSPDSTPAP